MSFVAFCNGVLAWLGMLVGVDGVSLEWFCGYIFRPLAFVMGVSWKDSEHVGQVIGIKTVVNEFVAYQRLGVLIRSEIITVRVQDKRLAPSTGLSFFLFFIRNDRQR